MKKITFTTLTIFLATFWFFIPSSLTGQNSTNPKWVVWAYYPLSGNTTDASGNNYNGTGTGITYVSDAIGTATSAASFNGTSSFITVGDYFENTTQISFSCWINPTNVTGSRPIITKYNSNIQLGGYQIFIASGRIQVSVHDLTDNRISGFTTNTMASIGQWQHLAVVVDLTQTVITDRISIYLNGTKQTLSFNKQDNISLIPNTVNAFRIGATTESTGALSYFMGSIDEVRVFNSTLSQSEITNLATGFPVDLVDIDGNAYDTVKIGTQVWMKQNLKTTKYNDGSAIPLVKDAATWITLTTPAYCYYNNDTVSNGPVYGALYNWYTVNTSKLCPSGWHVPTDAEWTTLVDYLGGATVAGGKLKETGTTHWSSSNVGATNSSRFTALGGGNRTWSTGVSYGLTVQGGFWSSTLQSANSPWMRMIYAANANINQINDGSVSGFSVRCMQDAATGQKPTINTTQPFTTNITTTTAMVGGNVTSEGSSAITERGVIYGPTSGINRTTQPDDSIATGSFSIAITGLSPSTQYYVKAYATNAVGTAYGDSLVFTTANLYDPIVPIGSGTQTDPYLIENFNNLVWVSINSSYWGSYFKQTANIDATSSSSMNSGLGLAPIGDNTTLSFTGNYNGNGFTVSGVFMNRPSEIAIGLFGRVANGTISNLGVIDATITGYFDVGALIGANVEGTVNNCYCKYATITGYNSVGGLIGLSSGIVNNSFARGTVSGTTNLGGLIGYMSRKVINCYSTCTVSGTSVIGGLIGYSFNDTITNSYWDTSLSGISASDGGTGLSTTIMTYPYGATAYVGWDFANTWAGDTLKSFNDGYPYLVYNVAQKPIVVTSTPHNLSVNTAISGGTITNNGSSALTEYGILWGTTSNMTLESANYINRTIQTGTGGTFVSSIYGLTSNTTYYARAYATNSEGTSYGTAEPFTTLTSGALLFLNIDMTNAIQDGRFIPGTDIVSCTGTFSSWIDPGYSGSIVLTDNNSDNIYEGYVSVEANQTQQYKYAIGYGWNKAEWDGGPNRAVAVVVTDVTTNDIYKSSDPNIIFDPSINIALPSNMSFVDLSGTKYLKVALSSSNVLPIIPMTLPANATTFKFNSKYEIGTSGYSIDMLSTYLKLIQQVDPSTAYGTAAGNSNTILTEYTGNITTSGAFINALDILGCYNLTNPWIPIQGDYIYVGKIEAIPNALVDLTFNVNMSSVPGFNKTSDIIYVTGGFTNATNDNSNWDIPGSGESLQLTDDDGDLIYTATTKVYTNTTYQYKYFKGAGLTGGEWDGEPNRSVIVGNYKKSVFDIYSVSETHIIFDPAAYNAANLPDYATMVEIDGEKYMKILLQDWTSHVNIFDVTLPKTDCKFQAIAKFEAGTSGYSYLDLNTVVNIMDTTQSFKVTGGMGNNSQLDFYPYVGLLDFAGRAVNQLEFAGQYRSGSWPGTTGDYLYVGKIVAFDDHTVLFNPSAIDASSLPSGMEVVNLQVADWGAQLPFLKVSVDGWNNTLSIPSYETGLFNKAKATMMFAPGSSSLTADLANTVVNIQSGGSNKFFFGTNPSSETLQTLTVDGYPGIIVDQLQLFVQNTTDWTPVTGAVVYLGTITSIYAQLVKVEPTNTANITYIGGQNYTDIYIDGNDDDEMYTKVAGINTVKRVSEGSVNGTPAAANAEVTSNSDSYGEWKAVWDNENLYFFIDIQDDDPIDLNGSTIPWFNDGIELFVDIQDRRYEGMARILGEQHQFRINLGTTGPAYGGFGMDNNTFGSVANGITDIDFAINKTSNSYSIECAVPWATFYKTNTNTAEEALALAQASGALFDGKQIAFEVSIIDANVQDIRKSILSWGNNTGLDKSNTTNEYYGQITLTQDVVVKPTIVSISHSGVTSNAAKLTSVVNANGVSTNIVFKYGKTISVTNSVNGSPYTITGTTSKSSSITLSNLEPNTKYYYKVIATNTNGQSTTSSTKTFTTTDQSVIGVTVYGNNSVCYNQQNIQYWVDQITGASYNWTVENGNIDSGQGTSSIRVNWANSGSTGYVAVDITGPDNQLYAGGLNITFSGSSSFNKPIIREKGAINILICTTSGAASYQWYKDNAALSGQTGQYFVARNNYGNYSVTISDYQGCSVSSDNYTLSSKKSLTVYPNPVSHETNIIFDSEYTGVVTVNLVDVFGKTIRQVQFEKNEFSLDKTISVDGLEKGVYMLEVTDTGTKLASERIIIN